MSDEKREHVSPLDIDFDRLIEEMRQPETMGTYVRELMDESYRAGRDNVITEGPARAALLDGYSHWLDRADDLRESQVGRTISRVIADAFRTWADACRPTPKPTLDQSTSEEVAELQEVLEDTPGRHSVD